MMEVERESIRKTARLQAEQAAGWLHLIRRKSNRSEDVAGEFPPLSRHNPAYPGAPSFSPSLCHYHSMLDPDASDDARLEACRAMLACVKRRLPIEDFNGLSKWREERRDDPYGKAWRTTRFGAELYMIAHLLELAIAGFEEGCR